MDPVSEAWDSIAGHEYRVMLVTAELDERIRVSDDTASIQVYFDERNPDASEFYFTGGVDIFAGSWFPLSIVLTTMTNMVIDGDQFSGSVDIVQGLSSPIEFSIEFSAEIIEDGQRIELSIESFGSMFLQRIERRGLTLSDTQFRWVTNTSNTPEEKLLRIDTGSAFPYSYSIDLRGERFALDAASEEPLNRPHGVRITFYPPSVTMDEDFDGILTITEANGNVSEVTLHATVYPNSRQ